ncbi:hypothetical protein SS37A_39980 (plasmid) [Methylocystis iwaonis]|uniref:Uncharacterized protein n=1 Tax=Methylocystis iwaonis TaxID=2885079 RepID=A0ABM8EET6_9HYPH|nr:hypothetical protein SS37A_39980 [Methylocystis iwaonis]
MLSSVSPPVPPSFTPISPRSFGSDDAGALGNEIGNPFYLFRDSVDWLVGRNETSSGRIPMRLLHLGAQIHCRRMLVEKFNGPGRNVLG